MDVPPPGLMPTGSARYEQIIDEYIRVNYRSGADSYMSYIAKSDIQQAQQIQMPART